MRKTLVPILLSIFITGLAVASASGQLTPEQMRANAARFNAMPPKQHAELAIQAAKRRDFGVAENNLNAIPAGALHQQTEHAIDAEKKAAHVATGSSELAKRRAYASDLESSLLEKGIDAHVRVVGKDTLRISWLAMSRPVVYNMINSPGMQTQVPALGFRKVIFADDGSFSGTSTDAWTYRWTSDGWRQ